MDAARRDKDTSTVTSKESSVGSTKSKYGLLESVHARFLHQHQERQERVLRLQSKREAEVAHSRYLKQHAVDPTQMAEAKFVVGQWAKKHGNTVEKQIKEASRNCQLKNKTADATFGTRWMKSYSERRNRARVTPTHNRLLPETTPKMWKSCGITSDMASPDATPALHKEETDSDVSDLLVNVPKTDQGGLKMEDPVKTEFIEIDNGDSVVSDSDEELSIVSATGLSSTRCCVLNCEAEFSTKQGILSHEAYFTHSPCNPLLLNTDCSLSAMPAYACSKCWRVFETGQLCRDHQIEKGEELLPPLTITGYMCPQCMFIFSSVDICQDHMTQYSHVFPAYPFSDDVQSGTTPAEPLPVTRKLTEEFCRRCREVEFTVNCLDCTLIIQSNTELIEHLQETNHQHWHMNAMASLQPVDVFSAFLSYQACGYCDSVIIPTEDGETSHRCTSKEKDCVTVELGCKTLEDFVRRCCIFFETSVTSEQDDHQDSTTPLLTESATQNYKRKHHSGDSETLNCTKKTKL